MRQIVFRFVIAAAIIMATAFFSYAYAATLEESFWEVKKSNHFAVYYKSTESTDYVNDILTYAERYYDTITDRLGFRRFEFWTWDNQCKIYLYSTPKDYYSATGQPGWSGATAYVKERIIRTFVHREEFLQGILPHEMTHLIFREFVGYNTDIPLWLDEGMACLQEEKNRKQHMLIATVLVKSEVFIPIPKLTRIVKEGLVMPGVFYAESASVIGFLLEKYGREKFVDYCRYLRDNKNWEEGLKKVYGFKDLSDMNDKWIQFLSEKSINTDQ